MRVKLLMLGLLAAGLMASNAFAEGHHQSGINGEVVIYICPVVRPGVDCYRPFQLALPFYRTRGVLSLSS